MRNSTIKILFIICSVSLLWSFTHKYYLSVSDVVYNKEEQSLQIITRLFFDDLEEVLQERYDESIIVDETKDQKKLDRYIKKYLESKLQIKVNDTVRSLNYLGKEYEDDFVVCYIEVTDIKNVEKLQIENTLLMDVFPEQKNMMHTDVLGKKKSVILIEGNAKAVLNFSE